VSLFGGEFWRHIACPRWLARPHKSESAWGQGNHLRILVGKDAVFLDKSVREDPESAYTPAPFEMLKKHADWKV
jgi:hypothetical protein